MCVKIHPAASGESPYRSWPIREKLDSRALHHFHLEILSFVFCFSTQETAVFIWSPTMTYRHRLGSSTARHELAGVWPPACYVSNIWVRIRNGGESVRFKLQRRKEERTRWWMRDAKVSSTSVAGFRVHPDDLHSDGLVRFASLPIRFLRYVSSFSYLFLLTHELSSCPVDHTKFTTRTRHLSVVNGFSSWRNSGTNYQLFENDSRIFGGTLWCCVDRSSEEDRPFLSKRM